MGFFYEDRKSGNGLSSTIMFVYLRCKQIWLFQIGLQLKSNLKQMRWVFPMLYEPSSCRSTRCISLDLGMKKGGNPDKMCCLKPQFKTTVNWGTTLTLQHWYCVLWTFRTDGHNIEIYYNHMVLLIKLCMKHRPPYIFQCSSYRCSLFRSLV